MREGEIPVFYGEITNEGRQLPPFVCYLLLPRFGGEYGLVNKCLLFTLRTVEWKVL